MEAAVCRFHFHALESGEPYAREGGDILVGTDLAPEVFSFIAHRGEGGDYFELIVGRDRVEEQRIRVRISKELLTSMRDWA